MYLNAWYYAFTPVGGTVSGDYQTFRLYTLPGGSMALGVPVEG